MDISGIQKMTLLDYPGKCACTVFLAGCNLRCPFCHNASLVLSSPEPAMRDEEFFSFLKKRKGLLDGVCITGGEPTLRRDLPDFIRRIRDMGYLIKLDTNGSNPAMLEKLLEEKLLDYVAMDIKNCPVEWEIRTTCVKPFHDRNALEAIGKWLSGTENYHLQSFVDSGDLVGTGVSGFTKEEMEALRQAVLPYIPNTRLRGI